MVTSVCSARRAYGDMPDTLRYGVDEARPGDAAPPFFDGPTNFIDTARTMGSAAAIERIGAAIRERGGLPEGFIISQTRPRFETSVFDAPRPPLARAKLKALGIDRSTSCICNDPEHASSFEQATAKDRAARRTPFA